MKLLCVCVGRDRAAARSPSRAGGRPVEESEGQHAARGRVGEAAPRSEQHQSSSSLLRNRHQPVHHRVRARAVWPRSTRSTYLNNLGFVIGWTMVTLFGRLLVPATAACALCALLSLPSTLWAAAAAGPVRAVDKTENRRGNAS